MADSNSFKIKVKYGFASQFIGNTEMIAEFELPRDADVDAEIKLRAEEYLGLPWDDNCYYTILRGRLYIDFPQQSICSEECVDVSNSNCIISIADKEA